MTNPYTDANPFPVTQWTLVIDSCDENTEVRERALNELCRRYWMPIYAYARRLGHSPADSEDLTQGFYTMMLKRHDFGRADQDRGNFRAYIRTAFRNYVADFHKSASAKKRGGGAVIFSIDQEMGEDRYREFGGDEMTPERVFDRHFAISLLERALFRLRKVFEQAQKKEHFEALQPFLDEGSAPSYKDVASTLKLSVSAAKSAVHRFRVQYRRVLVSEIGDTLGKDGDPEAELQYLLGLFS